MPIPRSLPFIISAWSVPVLIIGQFAMLALIPVVIVLVTALRNASLRALRWWAFALGAAYATALILWVALPDRAPSLSKDLHPVVAGVIVAAAVGAAITYHVRRRRSRKV
jgi:ABC-type transporter Mla maintaining outer membrane lipid asymmetry permease subunit MlaE